MYEKRSQNSKNKPVSHRDLWAVLRRELDNAEYAGLKILFWLIPKDINSDLKAVALETCEKVRSLGLVLTTCNADLD